MSGHQSLPPPNENMGGPVHDHTFEPDSSFDFEDELCSPGDNITSFNAFRGENMRSRTVDGMYDEDMDYGVFHSQVDSFPKGSYHLVQGQHMPNVDSTNLWQDAVSPQIIPKLGGHFGSQPSPQSAQNEIVNSRRDRVSKQFGQITPPDEHTPESVAAASSVGPGSTNSQDVDVAKLTRSRRARNAANKRHSKTKKARKDSGQDEGTNNDGGEKAQSKNANVRREKNRTAAAKCRAKKRVNLEKMQDSHRKDAKRNNSLYCEMMVLRDHKAFLRNSLLQHQPEVCKCHTIHCFNLAQAQQLALGVGATLIGPPTSASRDRASSVHFPGSCWFACRTCPAPSPSTPAGGPNMFSRILSSFDSPLNYGFAPNTAPGGVPTPTNLAQDGHQCCSSSPGSSWILQTNVLASDERVRQTTHSNNVQGRAP